MEKDYVKFSYDENKITAFIVGDIDHHSARDLRRKIDTEFAECDCDFLTLDMSDVRFMDSSGLGLILGRFTKASAVGASFCVANPSPSVKKVLDIAGAERIISVKYGEVKETQVNG